MYLIRLFVHSETGRNSQRCVLLSDMNSTFYKKFRNSAAGFARRLLSLGVALCLVATGVVPPAAAKTEPGVGLPAPGSLVLQSDPFHPPVLTGLTLDPQNPLMFDFIVDVGDSRLTDGELDQAATSLIKYFLTAVTVPEDELWVNLSPAESDRIVAPGLSTTVMGRDLLAQDYLLKQLAASLLSPEEETGARYWDRLLSSAAGERGIPMETLNRIWIVPERADVVVRDNSVYVTGTHLKVMLEQDYRQLPGREASQGAPARLPDDTADLIRELILPTVEEEINNGTTFSKLRQIYRAMILATWFKRNLRDNILNVVYADRGKTEGVAQDDTATNRRIYQQYIEALKKGVYNQVREDIDPITRATVPRKYFSGGVDVRRLPSVLNTRIAQEQASADEALLGFLNEREDFLYVIRAGLKETRGAMSYQQTRAVANPVMRPERDAAILAVLDDVIRYEGLGLNARESFRDLVAAAADGEEGRDEILARIVSELLQDSYVQKAVDGITSRPILEAELRRVVWQYAVEEAAPAANGVPLEDFRSGPAVRPVDGLMVAVSLMDAGALINADGEIDYRDGLHRAQEIIPVLARDGVRRVYLYGGLYEIASTSRQLHQVPDDGPHFLKSDNGRVLVRIEGYATKHQDVTGAGRGQRLYDAHGNNFSILNLQRFNPKIGSQSSEENPGEPSSEKTAGELASLTGAAQQQGVEIFADFIPWLAPDAVDDDILAWTPHRRMREVWTPAEREAYDALDEGGREDVHRRLLDLSRADFLFVADDGYPVLVRHFNGGMNRDQVYLNAYLPAVQDYYINSLKNLIDLGIAGVRVDLAHMLLGANLRHEFPASAAAEEPWLRIMREVGAYARESGRDFRFLMETYDQRDKSRLQALGRKANVTVEVYHKDLEDAYADAVWNGGSAQDVAEALNAAIYSTYNDIAPRRMAPATFDDQSLRNIGGPTDGLLRMLVVLAEFGVPTMFDLREWIGHSGHVISMVGGRSPDGTITHPFVTDDEFTQRMTNGGLKRLVGEQPWREFAARVQASRSAEDQLILQQHADYPWFMLDYKKPVQRRRFVTVGWQNEQGLFLYVLNLAPQKRGSAEIWLPQNLRDEWGRETIAVDFEAGQEYRLVRVGLDDIGVVAANDVAADAAVAQDNAALSEQLARYVHDPEGLRQLIKDSQTARTKLSVRERELLGQLAHLQFNGADYEAFVEKGVSHQAHEKLGAHLLQYKGLGEGVYFAVWAPNAQAVSVVGDFNQWSGSGAQLTLNRRAGIWYGYVPAAQVGDLYKFRIVDRAGRTEDKTDPYAFAGQYATGEQLHSTASRVTDLSYGWRDTDWMETRRRNQSLDAPLNIYEMHLGSWKKKQENGSWRWMTYRELAEELIPYLRSKNYTHVELMPPTEHHYLPSWGYQVGSYFAPTARYGSPQDFKYLVDQLHQAGFGVFMDWVPAHFPKDGNGLANFDGTELYAHANPMQGEHPDWGTKIFNYGRHEVRSFLLSNAMFWLEEYHIDGIRVDAVSSMLYLDFGRRDGEWIPNVHGGRENLEAIAFLRDFNRMVHGEHPGVITAAEESTAWEGVTAAVETGGLGFDYKWSLGWMHDILKYLKTPIGEREFEHHLLTMYPQYAFSENFILPLGHDETVHLKRSLLGKMVGSTEQEFANLRLLFGYMATMPGKQLLFMGGDIGQPTEWNPDEQVSWDLTEDPSHRGIETAVQRLNGLVRSEKALHELDVDPRGFEWIDFNDSRQNVVSFMRRGMDPNEAVMVVFNFGDKPLTNYQLGAPWAGEWQQIFTSDAEEFGGQNRGVVDHVTAEGEPAHNRPASVSLDIPPLTMMMFKGVRPEKVEYAAVPHSGFATRADLRAAVDVAFRDPRGGYVESHSQAVTEGDTLTLRAVANRPDFDGTRKVYLYSNRNITGKWQREIKPARFVENREGRAVYEFEVKAMRNFEYTFIFTNEDGTEEWADLPFGNHFVEVNKSFEGNVAYVGMEFAPLIKVGGQADVMYELPKALAEAGNNVSVIIPHFKARDYRLEEHGFRPVEGFDVTIPFGYREDVRLTAQHAVIDGIDVYILDAHADALFARTYENEWVQFYDSVLLSRGALELLRALGKEVDVVNSADHHTALVPLYMRTLYKDYYANTGSVFTIHNVDYKGQYQMDWYQETGLPNDEEIRRLVIRGGGLNLMGVPPAVIHHLGAEGNYINTVSRTYAEEIRATNLEVERALRDTGHRFDGILNGLDFGNWDPDTDRNLAKNYSVAETDEEIAEARLANKRELQEILSPSGDKSKIGMKDPANVHGHLTPGSNRLLVGVVSRMVDQKQIDILAEMLEEMYTGKRERLDIDVLINGTGDRWLEDRLKQIANDARKHNINMSVVFVNEYVQILTQKMMSGVDVLVIPSDFEPSGLTQMQAMRYGAVPIVRLTGGLADTVFEGGDDWNGFVFEGIKRARNYPEEDGRRRGINVDGLYKAVKRAQEQYAGHPERWREIVRRGMLAENGWKRSLGDYMNVYAWLSDEMHRNIRGGTILSGDIVAKAKGAIKLRVESHSMDKANERTVYLRSTRGITGEWVTESVPAMYVETVDGHDIYEVEVEARRSFEYTFVFEYANGEQVELDLPEGPPRVVVKSEFEGAVAFVGMEFAPLVKVGGQGDVIYELPRSLVNSGQDVTVIVPKYKFLADRYAALNPELVDNWYLTVPFYGRDPVTLHAEVVRIDGIRVVLLDADSDELFFRPYQGQDKEFYESILLSRGAVDVLKHFKQAGEQIDVVNAADHHTGLVPLLMRTEYAEDFKRTGSVFTVHNVGYQGTYPADRFRELGLPKEYRELVEHGRQLNFLAIPPSVINRIDPRGNYINTVSPSYANETRGVVFGITEDEMKVHRNRYGGILNGLDFAAWDPATDRHIKANYAIRDGIDSVLAARRVNKQDLLDILSADGDVSKIGLVNRNPVHGYLDPKSDRLLFGVVSRLVEQKQIDIIADIVDDMISGRRERMPVDFLINGTGEPEIERRLAELARRAEQAGLDMSFVFVNAYLQILTQKMMAGVDALLIPSNYEPSGLTQMQAMRYGAIPIVRKTGGLGDTVSELGDNWVGFVFDGVPRRPGNPDIDAGRRRQNAQELYEAMNRAYGEFAFQDGRWPEIVEKAMKADNDWSRSLGDYLNVYSWLQEELRSKADPGFARLAKTLSDRYGAFIARSPRPERPFVLVLKGNYASGKSMVRRALIRELSRIGVTVAYEHDQPDAGTDEETPTMAEAVARHREAQILIYEVEQEFPDDAEEIDMFVRLSSDLAVVQKRIKAEMNVWSALSERVFRSFDVPEVEGLRADADIKLNDDLTDEEFENFIREGLDEMSFTRAPDTRERTANARLLHTDREAADPAAVRKEIKKKRPSKKSGILLHVSSLDSPYGIGDFGTPARRFVDFLAKAGQNVWQVLPLNTTDEEFGFSPYSAVSSFALDPLYISPERMIDGGLITPEEAAAQQIPNTGEVNYAMALQRKKVLVDFAYARLPEKHALGRQFAEFKKDTAEWLTDFVLFTSIHRDQGPVSWNEWPVGLRDRQPAALAAYTAEHAEELDRLAFEQFLLFEQWGELRSYAAKKGVSIIGDLPLYSSFDSADVWANPQMYDLDADKTPRTVSGAPPDMFNAAGQRWGHPTFRWSVMQRDGYRWWRRRLAHNLDLFDQIRLDHFRGLVAYWEIPAGDDDARNGRWQPAADDAFFRMISEDFGVDRFIAEDLGDISEEVRDVLRRHDFRTMKVLQFGFSGELRDNPYHPRNHVRRSVVYTGTHDNNTLLGWFASEVDEGMRHNIQRHLTKPVTEENVNWEFIQMAMESPADTAIVPMQDVLQLGAEARMNYPGSVENNWKWRLPDSQFDESVIRTLSDMKGRFRPKEMALYEKYGVTRPEVLIAMSALKEKNNLLMARRLQQMAYRDLIREGEFTGFTATTYTDDNGDEYIMVSSVDARGEPLDLHQRVANLIFAVGALAPFHMPLSANLERAQNYLDEALLGEEVGGIDLNPDQLRWNVRGTAPAVGQEVPSFVYPVPADIHGFVPVIINITPLQTTPLFFGSAPAGTAFETSFLRETSR